MGSNRTNQEIAIYTAQVIQELEDYLRSLTLKGDPDDKRADKIDQWIEKWTKYLKIEKNYNPKSISRFIRGSIVHVNFGFNVGMEYGGSHYAVVLNKRDSRKNHLLTVLPLTSIKENTDLQQLKYFQLSLGNEVHNLLRQKATNIISQIQEEGNKIAQERERINEKIISVKNNVEKSYDLIDWTLEILNNRDSIPSEVYSRTIEKYEDIRKTLPEMLTIQENSEKELDELEMSYNRLEVELEYAKKLISKINNLKQGSMALLNQVTTISKMRLIDPINKRSILQDITLSSETLDKIDEALSKIF